MKNIRHCIGHEPQKYRALLQNTVPDPGPIYDRYFRLTVTPKNLDITGLYLS